MLHYWILAIILAMFLLQRCVMYGDRWVFSGYFHPLSFRQEANITYCVGWWRHINSFTWMNIFISTGKWQMTVGRLVWIWGCDATMMRWLFIWHDAISIAAGRMSVRTLSLSGKTFYVRTLLSHSYTPYICTFTNRHHNLLFLLYTLLLLCCQWRGGTA